MRKIRILLLALLFIPLSQIHAGGGKKVIYIPSLLLKLTFEQSSGTNGSAVAYNPKFKFYYAAIAGNIAFPLETFSDKGANLFQSETKDDIRGMWWNPKTKSLEANSYYNGEILKLGLLSNGFAGGENTSLIETSREHGNSCGVLDFKKQEILYYLEGVVYSYSLKTGLSTNSGLGLTLPVSTDQINAYAMIFTGKKKMELGVLDYVDKKIYLFNKKNGEHTVTISLPANAITPDIFRFAFANDHVWLYDVDTRTWNGYKIFE